MLKEPSRLTTAVSKQPVQTKNSHANVSFYRPETVEARDFSLHCELYDRVLWNRNHLNFDILK